MVSLGILVIVAGIATAMYRNGITMWNSGVAQLQLQSEARISMMGITQYIHFCQGNTIKISRFGGTQPVDSAISAKLAETAFETTDNPPACGCNQSGVDHLTGGDAGQDITFYQNGNTLYFGLPNPLTAASTDTVTFNSIPMAKDLDMINFAFDNSLSSQNVIITARFSKKTGVNRVPVEVFIKKTVAIKHFHSAGYYVN
jgi:hypothetical protein